MPIFANFSSAVSNLIFKIPCFTLNTSAFKIIIEKKTTKENSISRAYLFQTLP